MSESMRDDVAREAERLVHLLSHPEPGIASWHEACERAYQRLIAVASPYAGRMREALRETLECLDGCMVWITSREKINAQEGPNWIAGMTAKARAILAEEKKT